MHRFGISYNLTRNYPYKWVTPVVVLGGLIAIVIITFIHIVTESYDLVATSTNNATQILEHGNPYPNSPLLSYLTRHTRATCASTTLPINSEIFTSNYAIPYTISSIWRQNQDGSNENQGALVYLNDPLLDCNVTGITIEVLGKYGQSPLLFARSRVGLLLKPSATCAIETSPSKDIKTSDKTYFNLLGSYNLIDDTIPHFLLRNETERPSLYWGESLLRLYSLVTAKAYYDGARNQAWGSNGTNPDTYSAVIQLRRQSNATNGSAGEVMSNEFFHVECFTEASFCQNSTIPWLMEGKGVDGHDFDPYPNIWNVIDFLGKAMWFTVMTDLGQNDATIPNMLTYPDLLANLSRNVTNEVEAFEAIQNSTGRGSTLKIDTSLKTTSFDPSAVPQPTLGAQSSYLSTNYICQVPRAKSAGTRAFAILIANLVLLHTIWQVFKLILDNVLLRRGGPSLKYCEGCLESHIGKVVEPMSGLSTGTLEERTAYQDRKPPSEAVMELNSYTQLNQTERHID
ncbi:hypothetical protein F4859DRAFT_219981 [Xylaria cf. heliscus]|nr:hypothetical protein F4859DRAFT_219981 [Xylaria cf. heliscus]